MTKKLWTGLLLVLLLGLVACGRGEQNDETVYKVYYLSSSESCVEMHEHPVTGEGQEAQLDELLGYLGETPEKLEYKAPLALGFQVLSYKIDGGKLVLDVDEAYRELAPTTEVLVRAAIVKTLSQVPDIRYIAITIRGEQLLDHLGEYVGWMNAEQFINNDGNEINTYELRRIKLYFANETGDKLIGAYREKHYSTNTPLERFIVEEVIAGPSGQVPGLYPTVNPETKIISVMTKDGICYVNLDSGFLTVAGNVSTELAVYSIVNSLVELSNVNKVQILVNGEVPASFSNQMFERNLDDVTTLE